MKTRSSLSVSNMFQKKAYKNEISPPTSEKD